MTRSEGGANFDSGAQSEASAPGAALQEAAAGPESRHRIRAARVALFYEVPVRILGHVANGALVVAVLWGHLPVPYLVGWFGLMATTCLVRYVESRRFPSSGRDPAQLDAWERRAIVWTTITAALWGGTSFVLWLSPEITYHVFIGFVIAGTSAAAAAMAYPILLSARLFLLLCVLPLSCSLLLMADPLYLAMGIMTLLYLFLLYRQVGIAHATLLRALSLQEENTALVAELSAARDNLEERVSQRTAELDEANEHLRKEMAARVETEGRLQQAQKMEAIGQLTGGIAHDFNNLLAVIQGNAELLSERLDDSLGKQELSAVLRASERGARLTQRLLAFSRRQTLQPEVVDVNELIASMAKMLGRTLDPGTEVEFRPGVRIDPASVDPGQLENAILNLAINARDAMGGGGRVVITTTTVVLSTDSDIHAAGTSPQPIVPGRYVVIAVADTGVGISREDLDKVWEPFFTTKPTGEGTGLGLSMVYGFVQQSGGRVTIDSARGAGTTVRMFLPSMPAGTEAAEELRFVGGHPHGDETILVIEDDIEVRSLVERYLRRLGYIVHATGDAEGAFRILAETGRPDLILSDVVLGGGHRGPALVETARSRLGPIKAIFMSGYAAGGGAAESWTDKEAVLLDKPFELSVLGRKVREVLDGPAPDSGSGEDATS